MDVKALHALLLGFVLIALAVGDSNPDLGAEVGSNSGLDSKTRLASVNDTDTIKKVDQVKDESALLGTSKEDGIVDNEVNKGNPTEQNESKPKEANEVETGDKGASEKSKGKGKNDGKKDMSDNESNEVTKGKGKEGDVGVLTPSREEGPQFEECDSPYKCNTEDNKLVACLRFPGNESPKLSLLIQNKGKVPVAIKISAPDYVKLEETKVQLKERGDKEVKVTIPNLGSEISITLTGGKGNCTLDFKDMFDSTTKDNSGGGFNNSEPINFFRQTPLAAIAALFGLLLLASAWMCIKLRRHLSRGESKYQRLDMELPVSNERKPEISFNDGWDDSWGDSWDDEEAPLTPSKPVTPSLSSKGLAARRAAKEGWKD